MSACVSRQASASETNAKIVPKSIPQEASGHPKSSQSRSRDSLRTPGSTKSILGATRERLGTSPARPGSARRASRSALGLQNHRPGVPESKPRRPKSTPSRIRERKKELSFVQLARGVFSEPFFKDFGSFFRRDFRRFLWCLGASELTHSAKGRP